MDYVHFVGMLMTIFLALSLWSIHKGGFASGYARGYKDGHLQAGIDYEIPLDKR